MTKSRVVLLSLLAMAVLSVLPVQAQQGVTIAIKGGTLQSMNPSVIQSNTPYVFAVTVLNATGNPVSGAQVQLVKMGGILEIQGQNTAQTNSAGLANLPLTFSAGGIIALYVQSQQVTTIVVLYSSPPPNMIGLVIVVPALLVGILVYALIEGPLKWSRAQKS